MKSWANHVLVATSLRSEPQHWRSAVDGLIVKPNYIVSQRFLRTAGVMLAAVGSLFIAAIMLIEGHSLPSGVGPTVRPDDVDYSMTLTLWRVRAFFIGIVCLTIAVSLFRMASRHKLLHDVPTTALDQEDQNQRRFTYVDTTGAMRRPLTRTELIDLIKAGTVAPVDQVWDGLRSEGWNGRWKPAWMALGVPREAAELGDIDAWLQSS